MVVGGTVEGRGNDLTLDRALHVGDFFWTLVHEHHHEVDLGVVGGDRVGDRLEHHRLAGLGRRDDQTSLALADRSDEVDHPSGEQAGLGLEPESILRVQRSELGEVRTLLGAVGIDAVDGVEANERVELLATLALFRLPNRASDSVTATQVVAAGPVTVTRRRRWALADSRTCVRTRSCRARRGFRRPG